MPDKLMVEAQLLEVFVVSPKNVSATLASNEKFFGARGKMLSVVGRNGQLVYCASQRAQTRILAVFSPIQK